MMGKQKAFKDMVMTKKKPLKITYISSPVMVRATTASEFRAIVQELTGKDSDVGVLSPHNVEGPTGRESGVTRNLPTNQITGSSPYNFLADDQYYDRDDDRKCFYKEEAFRFIPNNPMSARSFGLDEVFSWRDFSEGFVGFQSSRCISRDQEQFV